MKSSNSTSILAGRLLLAIADNDLPRTAEIFREAANEPGGTLELVVAISSVAIESAKLVSDDWRADMVNAINGLEIGELSAAAETE